MPQNAELVAAVDEAGWSPGRLAARVNALMGSGYLARTTVVGWLRDGRLPREPLPTVVAHVLSEVLGRPVEVRALWQGRAEPSAVWVPADAGMDVPWHLGGLVTLMRDWLGGDTVDRRVFLAVSGAALTGPAWRYVDSLGSTGGAALGGLGAAEAGRISHGMVDVVQATIRRLRDLDDREGGERENLRFVHREFDAVAGLVRTGRPADSAVMARLLGTWAQLGQLAGWMAYDGERHGPRSSLFHGSWLARALLRGGDVEAAVAVGQDSLDRLKVTRSPRAVTQLRHLEEDLATARSARTAQVTALRTHLRTATTPPRT